MLLASHPVEVTVIEKFEATVLAHVTLKTVSFADFYNVIGFTSFALHFLFLGIL
jgi:hypothetical protein